MTSSIRARVPSTKSQRGATVETHQSHRCGCHDPSYHKTHTFTSNGKSGLEVGRDEATIISLDARWSPFSPILKKTSLQATHFCHFSSVPTEERWANQWCYYIFIPRIFFLRSTDRFSLPILFPFSLRLWFPFDCFLFVSLLMDPGALGKELPTGQPMETKNSKKQALAKELTTLADKLLKERWKNSKGPTVPTP